MTVTLSPPVETIEWSDPAPRVVIASPLLAEDPGVWTATLRSVGGASELSDFKLSDELGERFDWTIEAWSPRHCEIGSATLKVSANHPDLALMLPYKAEVHLARNGVPKAAFVIVPRKATTADGSVVFGLKGIEEWTRKRTHKVPEADPLLNWFKNHDFAEGVSRWGGPVDSFDVGDVEQGEGSAVLNDSLHGLQQVVTIDSLDFDYEVLCRFRVKVDNDVPAYEPLRVTCPNTAPGGGGIRASTVRGEWTWVECTIQVYGTWDRSNQFTCRFAGPSAGEIKVDRAIFTIVNGTEVLEDAFDEDLPDPPITVQDSAIIGALALQPLSDVNITSRSTNTGITLATPAPGPQIIWDTLQNAYRLGALEWRMELAAPDLRTMVLAYRVGSLVTTIDPITTDPVAIVHNTNDGPFEVDEDAGDLANVVYAADGDGNYGTASDLTAFDGVRLERIVPLPQGVTDRDGYAEWSLRHEAPDVTTHTASKLPGRYLDLIQLGDRVPVTAAHGFFDLDATEMRVIGWTIDPHSDTITSVELTEYEAP